MTQEIIPLQLGEEIKPIQGYEGLYSITSFGRVWSHKRLDSMGRIQGGKFLNLVLDKNGYALVRLYKDKRQKSFRLHRLIAQHYIPNPDNLPEVNHKDGNKLNNFVGIFVKNYTDGNLEWCTKQSNENHCLIKNFRNKQSSKYYGVIFLKSIKNNKKPWLVRISSNTERIYLGVYSIEIEAAKAYNKYVIEHNLNRPLNSLP